MGRRLGFLMESISYLPLLEFFNVFQFLLQKWLQLLFIEQQSLFDTLQGGLEMSNYFLEEVVTDPFA